MIIILISWYVVQIFGLRNVNILFQIVSSPKLVLLRQNFDVNVINRGQRSHLFIMLAHRSLPQLSQARKKHGGLDLIQNMFVFRVTVTCTGSNFQHGCRHFLKHLLQVNCAPVYVRKTFLYKLGLSHPVAVNNSDRFLYEWIRAGSELGRTATFLFSSIWFAATCGGCIQMLFTSLLRDSGSIASTEHKGFF